MMTLRHDDMMERSPLPPQAGNTRLSYSHRCAARIGKAAEEEMKDDDRRAGKQHEPATGRQQQKMAEDFCPRHTNISLSAPGSYSKTISTSMLSGAKRIALSATFSNTFCSLSRSPRRSFTMLPGLCSTHPAFSGTSRLA